MGNKVINSLVQSPSINTMSPTRPLLCCTSKGWWWCPPLPALPLLPICEMAGALERSVADQDIILWVAAPCWAIRWSGARMVAEIQITCVMVLMCNITGSAKTWIGETIKQVMPEEPPRRYHLLVSCPPAGCLHCVLVTIPIMNIGSGGGRDGGTMLPPVPGPALSIL